MPEIVTNIVADTLFLSFSTDAAWPIEHFPFLFQISNSFDIRSELWALTCLMIFHLSHRLLKLMVVTASSSADGSQTNQEPNLAACGPGSHCAVHSSLKPNTE